MKKVIFYVTLMYFKKMNIKVEYFFVLSYFLFSLNYISTMRTVEINNSNYCLLVSRRIKLLSRWQYIGS